MSERDLAEGEKKSIKSWSNASNIRPQWVESEAYRWTG
jgi:hypothetical protein